MPVYASNRPWPGVSAWSNPRSRAALQRIADGAQELVDFRYAVINVLHAGKYRAIAVSGEESRRQLLMDSETTLAQLGEEVERSDPWGNHFLFAPGSQRPPNLEWGLTPVFVKLSGEDAWDPEDLLFAPLTDEAGTDIGFLSVDVPLGLRRPDAVGIAKLDRYALLVRDALVVALERDDFMQRLEEVQSSRSDASTNVSTISHELRSPLTGLVGHLELLSDSPRLRAAERRSVEAIGRASARLRRVIDDLLVLSTPARPHHHQVLDASVRDSIDEALDVTDLAARAANLHISVDPVPATVRVSAVQADLDRAVLNLLSNAIKYSRESGSIEIRGGGDAEHVAITVADHGIGISAEDQERLFTPLFRSTNPAAIALPGHGLGLAIVRELARRWGGDLTVASALGRGSCFRLAVPRLRQSEPES